MLRLLLAVKRSTKVMGRIAKILILFKAFSPYLNMTDIFLSSGVG